MHAKHGQRGLTGDRRADPADATDKPALSHAMRRTARRDAGSHSYEDDCSFDTRVPGHGWSMPPPLYRSRRGFPWLSLSACYFKQSRIVESCVRSSEARMMTTFPFCSTVSEPAAPLCAARCRKSTWASFAAFSSL
jgi:hypothetical protein